MELALLLIDLFTISTKDLTQLIVLFNLSIVFSWKLLRFVLLTHCRESDNIIVAKIKLGNQFEARF